RLGVRRDNPVRRASLILAARSIASIATACPIEQAAPHELREDFAGLACGKAFEQHAAVTVANRQAAVIVAAAAPVSGQRAPAAVIQAEAAAAAGLAVQGARDPGGFAHGRPLLRSRRAVGLPWCSLNLSICSM